MATETGRTFTGRVVVDEGDYRDCVFSGATIVYFGGRPPSFAGCTFEDCKWAFKGSASNTVSFLRAMSRPGSGFHQLVEKMLTEGDAGRQVRSIPHSVVRH